MDKSIRRGQTYEDTFITDDVLADTVQLIVSEEDGTVIINETANFAIVDGKNTALLSTNDTDHPVGDYKYMYWITDTEGNRYPIPDANDCEGDCELPKFTICEALEAGVS